MRGITLQYCSNIFNNSSPRGKKHPCNAAWEYLTRQVLDWIDNRENIILYADVKDPARSRNLYIILIHWF